MNSKIELTTPTGSHKVGVIDFELVDESREELFAPGMPRKIPVRAWYPAASVNGQPRPYAKPLELEHQIKAWFRQKHLGDMSEELVQAFTQAFDVPTNAFENAPVIEGKTCPVVIFSHGFGHFLQGSTALMEHLASHGYLVLSISHPYTAMATLHENGDVIPLDQDLVNDMVNVSMDPEYVTFMIASDPAKRYEATLNGIRNKSPVTPHFLVWEQDFIHTIDRLNTGNLPKPAKPLLRLADLDQLGTFGMSLGASGSAAGHKDARVRAAVNLDGVIFDVNLVDTATSIPTMVMHSQWDLAFDGITVYPHSEFCYERLTTMGTREDVIRLQVKGSMHNGYTDFCLLPDSIRARNEIVAGQLGTIDGQRMAQIVNDFVLRFFDYYLCEKGDGLNRDFREQYPEVEDVDVTHVREWATSDSGPRDCK
jgi:predicted dienelactone hydrolase